METPPPFPVTSSVGIDPSSSHHVVASGGSTATYSHPHPSAAASASPVISAVGPSDVVVAAVAAVAAETTARLFLQVLHEQASHHAELLVHHGDHHQQQRQKQPLLLDLLQRNPVLVQPEHNKPETLLDVLLQFDNLLLDCARLAGSEEANNNLIKNSLAPGFFTAGDWDGRWWSSPGNTPEYQTLPSVNSNSTLPVMSPASARPALLAMRQAIVERLRYLQDTTAPGADAAPTATDYCSCISHWDLAMNLGWVVNQALEQIMAQEGSSCLAQRWTSSEWESLYEGETNHPSSYNYTPKISTPIRLLRDRDTYINVLVNAATRAENTIQIMTCYVFWDDPAQQYILLDLLPHLVRKKNLRVQILIDLLTVESATLRSAFEFAHPSPSSAASTEAFPERQMAEGVTSTSFLKTLPVGAPPRASAHNPFSTAAQFWQALFDVAASCSEDASLGCMQVKFWCARDAAHGYRVKNHAKCVVFDRTACIMGGSNLAPTVKSATAELDAFMMDEAAERIGDNFSDLWSAMTSTAMITHPPFSDSHNRLQEEKKQDESPLMEYARSCEWDDDLCSVSILRSNPSSKGEDSIYRVVLDKIRSAEKSVLVCMGHACFPKSFANAVADATRRNVEVKIIVNSMYSNDLRTGQRDLFLSIRQLFRVAPQAQVYTTANRTDATDGAASVVRPEFLHAKYVVVDGSWVAMGSWNLWTRSAFYEVEHETFIESEKIAATLIEKFEADRSKNTVALTHPECNDGGTFCPKGCSLCKGFGPFFV